MAYSASRAYCSLGEAGELGKCVCWLPARLVICYSEKKQTGFVYLETSFSCEIKDCLDRSLGRNIQFRSSWRPLMCSVGALWIWVVYSDAPDWSQVQIVGVQVTPEWIACSELPSLYIFVCFTGVLHSAPLKINFRSPLSNVLCMLGQEKTTHLFVHDKVWDKASSMGSDSMKTTGTI